MNCCVGSLILSILVIACFDCWLEGLSNLEPATENKEARYIYNMKSNSPQPRCSVHPQLRQEKRLLTLFLQTSDTLISFIYLFIYFI